jgi:very-short-patch-repair endonuclease
MNSYLPLEGRWKFGELLAELPEGVLPHRFVSGGNRSLAKTMRRTMTSEERILWRYLRKPGIPGLRFRRQAPIGPYIVDFFCPLVRLVIEVDGGQHALSSRDEVRDAWLASRGYRVLRFWNNDVAGNIEGVCTAIARAASEPPPEIAGAISTSPQGGRLA